MFETSYMFSKYKFLASFIFIGILFLILPSSIYACTYNSTISGNHLDVQVQSGDWSNLGVLEIISSSHTPIWKTMYQPSGLNWVTTWENLGNNMYFGLVGGSNGDTAYWGFNSMAVTSNTIPYGIYGVDFIGTLTHQDYYVQMNHPEDFGSNYIVCQRNGDILKQNFEPVSKVFFIPGIGASWNVNAFINCKPDNNPKDWTLASYAKDIYNPVLTALTSSHWQVVPFYYDWTQDIRNSALSLNDVINLNTSQDEKVDLVGHSMGGLIGRNYLETQSGRKAAKFYAVGSPNQGSALAYPAAVDGKIWTDDLIEKIATTLFAKHCGIPKSLINLLPTYDYLRNTRTKQLESVTSMKNQNNYLPTSNFITPFWNVKVGTLAGNGQATLKIIDVIKDPKWPDGRPVDIEKVNEGDGTVLLQSAQITGASTNDVLNQKHSEIISSTDGINYILKFLGSPGISDPPYPHENSALILIGYPNTFQISDKNGITTSSENGMIAIMNPKDGNYQLQINPASQNTTFIVAQFLADGKYFYKEYKFKGSNQETKIIEFNNKHPNEDILHEVREYNSPTFPKFWFDFWKFWKNIHKIN